MQLHDTLHLTYCTNIHPGETWEKVFESLKQYLPALKQKLSPDKPFGIGLRLSDRASRKLAEADTLATFKAWLAEQGLYVYTMNGFPFGGFHHQVVKAEVHTPDWTTTARLDYTKRLAQILAALLPEGMEGGISTSPLSYKLWHHTPEAKEAVFARATDNFVALTDFLIQLKEDTGKTIHIDIEPEPDGMLENSEETIHYFQEQLLPAANKALAESRGYTAEKAREAVLTHIQLCYDVCHFALAYEKPEEAFRKLASAGIKIGKIQLSASLKVRIPERAAERAVLIQKLTPFVESTYLHQVVAQQAQGELQHYPDLHLALAAIQETEAREWRIHFHVPLFTDAYNGLFSTQQDIQQVLALLKEQPITHHLEVETYTWDVLPEGLKMELDQSIQRELEWVLETLNGTQHAENGRH